MMLVRRRRVFRNAAAEEVDVCFGCKRGERMVGWRLRGGGGRGEERFGIVWEVRCAVGGVEAFGQNDQRGACAGGFEHVGARTGEIGDFVGACWGGG